MEWEASPIENENARGGRQCQADTSPRPPPPLKPIHIPAPVAGGEGTQASDIYSLGMVLWEIATRLRPCAPPPPARAATAPAAQRPCPREEEGARWARHRCFLRPSARIRAIARAQLRGLRGGRPAAPRQRAAARANVGLAGPAPSHSLRRRTRAVRTRSPRSFYPASPRAQRPWPSIAGPEPLPPRAHRFEELMQRCWEQEPGMRPPMRDVAARSPPVAVVVTRPQLLAARSCSRPQGTPRGPWNAM